MRSVTAEYPRPRLFNWITVLLVSAWVLMVVILIESTEIQPRQDPDTVKVFIEDMLT